jgi:hypothetical protein
MRYPQLDWDDLPHREWECPHCGTSNSDLDAECQWCDNEPIDFEALRVDHILDHRKHNR